MEQLLEERNELGAQYQAVNDMDSAIEEQGEEDEALGIDEEDHEDAVARSKGALEEATRELKSKDYELQKAVENYERVTGRPAPEATSDELYKKKNWTVYRGCIDDYDDYNEDNLDPNYRPNSNVDPDNSSSNNHDNNSDNNDGGNDSGGDGYGSSGDSKVISEYPDVVIETESEVSELEYEDEYEKEIQDLDLDLFKDIQSHLNNTQIPPVSLPSCTLIDLLSDILKEIFNFF